jgi:hypothetical protein
VEIERHLDPAKRNRALCPHAGDAAGRGRDLAEIAGSARLRSSPAPDPSPQMLSVVELRCGAGNCGGK